jgi:hypothetical protein
MKIIKNAIQNPNQFLHRSVIVATIAVILLFVTDLSQESMNLIFFVSALHFVLFLTFFMIRKMKNKSSNEA